MRPNEMLALKWIHVAFQMRTMLLAWQAAG
jgi:hypothetical protein